MNPYKLFVDKELSYTKSWKQITTGKFNEDEISVDKELSYTKSWKQITT